MPSPQEAPKEDTNQCLTFEPNIFVIPVVPHKAVAEVSKVENLYERLVVVNHGRQSKPTDGSKGG